MHVQPSFPEFMPESNWRPPTSFPSIGESKWISIDCETRDPNLRTKGPGFIRRDAYVVGVAISAEGFSGYYPVRHAVGSNFAPNVVFPWLAEELKHFRGEIYGANLLYDLEALHYESVEFNDRAKFRDIQIAEPLIDEETAEGYSLEVLSNKYLGIGKNENLLRQTAATFTKGYKDKRCRRPIPFDPKGDLWMLPPEHVGEYAEGDVHNPRMIFQDHQSKIFDKEGLWPIFELESSLIPILLKMRIGGVAVDMDRAEVLKKQLTKQIDAFSLQIQRLVGFDPNVDSSQDLLKAYNILNFKLPEFKIADSFKYTAPSKGHPGGQASFTTDWFSGQRDPLSKIVQKKKKLMTLRDDFIIGDILDASVNGRVHSQFHQLRQDDSGTRSGRFSSTNPNLQQVPARHDGCDKDCPDNCTSHIWGKSDPVWSDEVRKLFIPDKGKRWFKGDFSQQEPRLTIHFASLCNLPGSEVAVKAFRENPRTDYHQLTTDIVNAACGKNFKRKQIKAINLGLVYGMGLLKLSRQLKISIPDAQEILSEYHDALAFVRGISNKAMSTAQERGYILTILKRRRRFNLWEPIPESKEERKFKVVGLTRELAEQRWPGRRLQRSGIHKALNGLIQGSAADQTKEAMRQLYYDHNTVMQIQVHDELDGSVDGMDDSRIIKKVMEEAVPLRIPVICDGALGDSWGNAKEEVLAA